MEQQQPEGPFKVAGYPQEQPSVAAARIFAGQKQSGGDLRSMQIFDRHGSVVDLKRC